MVVVVVVVAVVVIGCEVRGQPITTKPESTSVPEGESVLVYACVYLSVCVCVCVCV